MSAASKKILGCGRAVKTIQYEKELGQKGEIHQKSGVTEENGFKGRGLFLRCKTNKPRERSPGRRAGAGRGSCRRRNCRRGRDGEQETGEKRGTKEKARKERKRPGMTIRQRGWCKSGEMT